MVITVLVGLEWHFNVFFLLSVFTTSVIPNLLSNCTSRLFENKDSDQERGSVRFGSRSRIFSQRKTFTARFMDRPGRQTEEKASDGHRPRFLTSRPSVVYTKIGNRASSCC